jgi:hypothetical protein
VGELLKQTWYSPPACSACHRHAGLNKIKLRLKLKGTNLIGFIESQTKLLWNLNR